MKIIKLVECTDHRYEYGTFRCADHVSAEEVQNKIYEIKNKYYDENYDDWLIAEIFAEFPDEWEIELVYNQDIDVVEI